MLSALVAGAGTAGVVAIARMAWREPIQARLRGSRTRSPRRVPDRVRSPLARALEDAGAAVTPEEAVGAWATGTVVAVLLSSAMAPALAPLAGVAVGVGGPVALLVARGRGQRRFVAALPTFVELVAARLRSGHTVATALTDAARRRDPVAPDAGRIVGRVELGDPLIAALAWWADTRRIDAVRAVAGAMAVATETGGAAADALEGLARSLRDQLGARAEAASLSAQARLSAVVVGAAPVAYLVFASAVDPDAATALLTTPTGRVCLVLGIALDGIGVLWMRRIVRSEP